MAAGWKPKAARVVSRQDRNLNRCAVSWAGGTRSLAQGGRSALGEGEPPREPKLLRSRSSQGSRGRSPSHWNGGLDR
jgi:hypothetical protein